MSPQDLGWCSFSTGVPLPGLGSGQLSLQLPPPSGSAPPCTPHSGSARGPRGPATQPNAGRCRGSYSGCPRGWERPHTPLAPAVTSSPRPAPLPCPAWTTHPKLGTASASRTRSPRQWFRSGPRRQALRGQSAHGFYPAGSETQAGWGLGVTPQARRNQVGVAAGKTR